MTIFFFFFNDTATTEIYTLSLHDALPISIRKVSYAYVTAASKPGEAARILQALRDANVNVLAFSGFPRSEEHRLNSSHSQISYAVFCLKKKKIKHSLEWHYLPFHMRSTDI